MGDYEPLPPVEFIDLTHKNDRRYYTATGNEKVPCPQCGKLVWGMTQHRKAKHADGVRVTFLTGPHPPEPLRAGDLGVLSDAVPDCGEVKP